MNRRLVVGSILIMAGIPAGVLWAWGYVKQPFAPVFALMLFLAGASCFSKTSRFADELGPFVGKYVHVQVWGSELSDQRGASFSIETIRAIGAALHIYLRLLPHGSSTHLKIAQPLGTTLDETGFAVNEAKYVQWAGKKLKKAAGEKAFVITLK